MFCDFLRDITNQLSGLNGKTVLSQSNTVLPIRKNVVLLDRFVPFELNSKALTAKINDDLEKKAISEEFYYKTVELLSMFNKYLDELSFDYDCEIDFTKTDIGSFIKSSGVAVRTNTDSLAEQLLDFFALTTEFVGKCFFITVNLRSFLTYAECELFMKTVLMHGYDLLMLEGFEHKRISCENRVIIDEDLCLIN